MAVYLKFLFTLLPLFLISISKPVLEILDKKNSSPALIFSIVIPIVGNAELAATSVPLNPVKKDWAKVTDLVEVVEAIAVLQFQLFYQALRYNPTDRDWETLLKI